MSQRSLFNCLVLRLRTAVAPFAVIALLHLSPSGDQLSVACNLQRISTCPQASNLNPRGEQEPHNMIVISAAPFIETGGTTDFSCRVTAVRASGKSVADAGGGENDGE